MNYLQILVVKGDPNILRDWVPQEWMQLLLVCKKWRDFLYDENALAIDWGWQNDWPLRFCAKLGFEKRVTSLLKNPVVNPAALNNAPLTAACAGGHLGVASQLLSITPLDPCIEILIITLAKKHADIAALLIRSGRVDLSEKPQSMGGLETQQQQAFSHRCSLALVLATELGDLPEVVVPLYRKTPSSKLLLRKECWKSFDQLVSEVGDLKPVEFESILLARLALPIDGPTLDRWMQRLPETVSLDDLLTKLDNPAATERLLSLRGCSDNFVASPQFVQQLGRACTEGLLPLLKTLTKPEYLASISITLLQDNFLESIKAGHGECIKHFLTLPRLDPSYNDNEAICLASEKSRKITRLLASEPGVAGWARQNTPLQNACRLGDLKLVKYLLTFPRCQFSILSLTTALKTENIDLVEFLLSELHLTFELNVEIIKFALVDVRLMNLIVANYHGKLRISEKATLVAIVELLLLSGETKWLAYFVDSRILLWNEVSRIYADRHLNQVNRERIDLQPMALPFFRGLLGTNIGRVATRIKDASYMIFVLCKNQEWIPLISAAGNAHEFIGADPASQDLFRADVCMKLLKSTIDEQTCRIFFKSVHFTHKVARTLKAEKAVANWLALHQPALQIKSIL